MTKQYHCVQFESLSKSFYDGDKEIKIVEDINVGFQTGKTTLILGRSGSGKSTLLNLITGVDVPSKGRVLIKNVALSDLSEDERTLFRRKYVGIIFQSFYLIPSLTVLENIMFPLELNNINGIKGKKLAYEFLQKVELHEKADVFPDTLSGGEQQKTAIGRALVHNPDIIVADEPTGNLDSKTREQIINILLNLVYDKKKTLIMATHSEDLIDLCDNAYFIKNSNLEKIK